MAMEATRSEESVAETEAQPLREANQQTNLQLAVLRKSFDFFHAWQPSSLEFLDEGYCENESNNDGSRQDDHAIIVKDLPSNVDDDGLRDFFSAFGPVADVTLSRDVATITFEDGSKGAEKALRAQPMTIFGQAVVITPVVPKGTRRRRRTPSDMPCPVVVAPPNFGPLHRDHVANASESKGILNKATETLASAAEKNHRPQNQMEQNGRLNSAPPELARHQRKASLHSLLSSPLNDPLFDDDEHFAEGPSHMLQHSGGREEDHRKRRGRRQGPPMGNKMKHFHSDDALLSWVWVTERQSSPLCASPLTRGHAFSADQPLLAAASRVGVISNDATDCSSTCLDKLSQMAQPSPNGINGLGDTSLKLLHKIIELAARESTRVLRGGRVGNDCAPSIGDSCYQTRHPGLAPLISATNCSVPNHDSESQPVSTEKSSDCVVSIFDITPAQHRSLHDFIRCEDSLRHPLFPGVDGHEMDLVADEFTGPRTKGSPLSWFRGPQDKSDGYCSCHKSPNRGDDWRGPKQTLGGTAHSSSEPDLIREDSDYEDLHSFQFFSEMNLQKLRDGGAVTVARALVDQSSTKFIRGRRPWKLVKAGSSHSANVADLRIRFIALQLFHAVKFVHKAGVTFGEQLAPDRIFVQEDGWLRLVLPITHRELNSTSPETTSGHMQTSIHAPTTLESPRIRWRSIFRSHPHSEEHLSIIPYPGYGDVPTLQWARGQLTNLCYLSMLNAASGRTIGDLANPPIFPWVTSFSSEIASERISEDSGAWRDLSKSKFRLKKGDEQLDRTFAAAPPHHVPESLCELTYSVYRARCLPRSHLQKIVRGEFVGAHYPRSVQSLFDWTPDEATIEFYAPVQPSIFHTCHPEMDDLALPAWCSSPDSFIAYHRRLLESDHVSHLLHLWIDLNFGEALTGKRAVAEKNVALSPVPWGHGGLRDQCQGFCHSVFNGSSVDEKQWRRSSLKKCGPRQPRSFVQLFSTPHPRKHSGLRNAVTSAWTALGQIENGVATVAQECEQFTCHDDIADFQSRKQRDFSTIGGILKDCYAGARVIPSAPVNDAIDMLLRGTFPFKEFSSETLLVDKTFPYPDQLEDAYQFLSTVQNTTFQRRSQSGLSDSDDDTIPSTELEQVWKLIQHPQRLDALTSTTVGFILPTTLLPLKSIDPFIENCVHAHYPSFTERLCKYLGTLSAKLPADLIVPQLFDYMDSALDYAFASSHRSTGMTIVDDLGKIMTSHSLMHALYSSSSGEGFIAQVSSFAIKRLCAHSTDPEIASLQRKTMTINLLLLSQEDMIGLSMCCKYIIPSLVHSLHRSSVINGENTIVHVLKTLLPSLPTDAVAILICKPILRNIMPAQLTGGRPKTHNNLNATELSSPSTTKNCLLKELVLLLKDCVCHLDPNTAATYFVQLYSGTNMLLKLLCCSFGDATLRSEANVIESTATEAPALSQYDSSRELLKETSNLVCDVIGRIHSDHYNEVYPIIEQFSSRVNDEYLSVALHKSFKGHEIQSFLSMPGIQDTLAISNKACEVLGKEVLEAQCPSALEFLSWTGNNQAGRAHIESAPLDSIDEEEEAKDRVPCSDSLDEVTGGDGMSLEMRAPQRQTKPVPSGVQGTISSENSSHVSMADSTGILKAFSGQEEDPESKRFLAWLFGLNKEERGDKLGFRYIWQPRMMLVNKLGGTSNVSESAITSMSVNRSESLLAAGNAQGELFLFDLRRHPPVMQQKTQLINDDTSPITQLDFFQNDGTILACNGDLHLFDTATQTVLSSLSSENAYRHNSRGQHRTWKGDNFVGFSSFPKGTGLGEIMGDSTAEFAAISSSHLYTIDLRCRDSVSSHHDNWRHNVSEHAKKTKSDPMFQSLTWNAAACLSNEGKSRNDHATAQVRDDKASFDLLCVTSHTDWICTGSSSGHLHCFDRRRGKILSCWKGHGKSVEHLKAVSRDRLLSVSGDKTAVMWDMTKTPPQQIGSIYSESHSDR
ncbi:hypothetical protein ACHAWF_012343 [Thalassiosira exigua]